jgi:molecular chaperone GrpE
MSDQQGGDSQENGQDAEEQQFETAEAVADAVAEEIEVLEENNADIENTAKDLETLLKQAESKLDEQQNQIMRAHAEIENLKRRHSQDLEKAHKYALDKFVAELLTVWDSLELGNAAAQDDAADVEKLREGTGLTLKMLADTMQKFGVEQHDPSGEPFNPELHQAMAMQPSDEVEPNHVIAVVQKGYSLNGRLVRPAMVMVSQTST